MTRPNILWICSDQQRFDTLGCSGNPWVRTPHLDQLAAGGTLLQNAFCQNPLCTPSRASFLTGRYPRITRARQNGQRISDHEILVTRLFRDAGYACGLSGKLHLSACDPTVTPLREKRIDDGYEEFHWSHHPDEDWPEADYNHWLRENGLEYGRQPFPGSAYVQTSMDAEHHQTTWCADWAIDFMERKAGSRTPWLFSVNMFDPHHPFDPPAAFLERYLERLEEIPLPNYVEGELDTKPVFQRIDHSGAYGGQTGLYPFDRMTATDHRLIKAAYWSMCDLIDVQVGRMLEALERTGQRENTLVVYMSDHGELLGDHGIYLKGPHFYEPAIRVPLILSWPEVIESQTSGSLIELVDLAPTLLTAAGLPVHPGMQGKSFWSTLTGGDVSARRHKTVYCEHYGTTQHTPESESAYATMLRTERYKLVVFHGHEEGELYDLEEDPSETRNLWAEMRVREVRCDLMQQLCDRMAWTVDPLPQRAGRY